MINIFIFPSFGSPSSQGATGGIISNYYLVKAANKFSKTIVIVPDSGCSEEFEDELFIVKKVNIGRTTGVIGRLNLIYKMKRVLVRLLRENQGLKINVFFTTTTIPVLLDVEKSEFINKIIISRAYEDFIYSLNNKTKKINISDVVKKIINLGKTKKAYSLSDLVITNSDYMCLEIKQAFPEVKKIIRLYPPMDFNNKSEKSISSKKLIKLPENREVTFGFIGRGDGKEKGIELIVNLSKKFPKNEFKLYGLSNLNKEKQKNLKDEGWKPFNEIVKEIDVLLIPSLWKEPFGRVAVEAQYFDIPVIVSKYGGLAETVSELNYFCDPQCIDEWIAAIGNLKSNGFEIDYEFLEKFSIKQHNAAVRDALN